MTHHLFVERAGSFFFCSTGHFKTWLTSYFPLIYWTIFFPGLLCIIHVVAFILSLCRRYLSLWLFCQINSLPTMLYPYTLLSLSTSLITGLSGVQWLTIYLPIQGAQIQPLVWKYPTRCRVTKPVYHNGRASALEPVSRSYWNLYPQKPVF